jgi:ABC-type multidrug transport system permease subunit
MTMSTTIAEPPLRVAPARRRSSTRGALSTLARRRVALTSRTPRQIAVPLLGPALLALIAAPALAVVAGAHLDFDYQSFIDVGAVGLLIPLSCVFAGISVLVDRRSGAQRELLAAPVSRPVLVLANLVVAVGLAALQVAVLIGLAALRGASFEVSAAGVAWFAAGALLFTVFMYAVAETLASRLENPEDYTGAVPAVAILPFFFGGGLYPIGAMPGALTAIAKFLPLTHALALLRYGLVDHRGSSLHAIWGAGNTTTQAWLSLAVVAAFAAAMTAVAIRAFGRSAVR